MQRFDKIVFIVFIIVFASLSFAAPASAQYPWVPYKGYSIVDQSQTKQTFTFSKSAVKEFGSKSTYECETQIYDKKFADCEGKIWHSSLPHYYIDTQWCDFAPLASGEVDNFTMGSAEANKIKGETEYYTYIKLKPGSVKSAEVIIKGQKGHRIIDNKNYPLRYSTWNIAADATSNGLLSFKAPSGKKPLYYHGVDSGRVIARH